LIGHPDDFEQAPSYLTTTLDLVQSTGFQQLGDAVATTGDENIGPLSEEGSGVGVQPKLAAHIDLMLCPGFGKGLIPGPGNPASGWCQRLACFAPSSKYQLSQETVCSRAAHATRPPRLGA